MRHQIQVEEVLRTPVALGDALRAQPCRLALEQPMQLPPEESLESRGAGARHAAAHDGTQRYCVRGRYQRVAPADVDAARLPPRVAPQPVGHARLEGRVLGLGPRALAHHALRVELEPVAHCDRADVAQHCERRLEVVLVLAQEVEVGRLPRRLRAVAAEQQAASEDEQLAVRRAVQPSQHALQGVELLAVAHQCAHASLALEHEEVECSSARHTEREQQQQQLWPQLLFSSLRRRRWRRRR
mmetsp:Transcript_1906/g.6186  ORF Transcript_1906/g.6186 Transcript_1906/m.6186 type:complete len:242 (+) Transcript_1906:80-805(+)